MCWRSLRSVIPLAHHRDNSLRACSAKMSRTSPKGLLMSTAFASFAATHAWSLLVIADPLAALNFLFPQLVKVFLAKQIFVGHLFQRLFFGLQAAFDFCFPWVVTKQIQITPLV